MAWFKKKENKNTENPAKLVRFIPLSYKEARLISKELTQGNVVYVDLKDISTQEAVRLLDFISGTLYAMNGKARKITELTFLFAPNTELLNKFTLDNLD